MRHLFFAARSNLARLLALQTDARVRGSNGKRYYSMTFSFLSFIVSFAHLSIYAVYKCPGRMDGAKLQPGFDSHEDPSGYEWVVYHEESILPVS